jgi:hypothetical protein
MHPRIRTLQPAHPQRSSVKTHIINSQVYRFTAPQPMPVHHQEEKMVSGTLPPSFCSFKERNV